MKRTFGEAMAHRPSYYSIGQRLRQYWMRNSTHYS